MTSTVVDILEHPKARVSYQTFYYDAVNRLTDSVDVGTNGTNGAYSRPGTAPTNSTSALHLVHTDYSSAGWGGWHSRTGAMAGGIVPEGAMLPRLRGHVFRRLRK